MDTPDEVLLEFESRVESPDGKMWKARARGRPLQANLWEGWIEFERTDGSASIRSPRETTQPNREHLVYWATGLEPLFLEGSLQRALAAPQFARSGQSTSPSEPSSTRPAPRPTPRSVDPAPLGPLDPENSVLEAYHILETQGEEILRQELTALAEWQLRNVAEAYDVEPRRRIDELDRASLQKRIVEELRRRVDDAGR